MNTLVLLELTVRPEALDAWQALMTEALSHTRSHAGCLGAQAYTDPANPGRCVVLEHWTHREAHQAYAAQADKSDLMPRLGALMAGPPSLRYLDQVSS